jgi:hypothetical protein
MGTVSSVEERQAEQIHSPPPPSTGPIPGDVLASRATARADLYWISVVPHAAHMTARRYSEAIEAVGQLARQRRVDGWFTCDHTHYAHIAHYNRR